MSTRCTKSNKGIALIIVLGFLALLTLLAVSFSIEMRTERLTSAVYMDAGEARNYIDVAIARALAEVDRDLVNRDLNAPDWSFLASSSASGVSGQLYQNEATLYVPRFDAGTPTPADFIDIPNPAGGDPIGRYAYLVVNQTGLLDVNEVGKNGTNRFEGASPAEIRITDELNPEITNWTAFATALQSKWRRVETMNEFGPITSNKFDRNEVSSLGLYARSLPELDPEGNPKYQLTDAADLINNAAEVIRRLELCGFSNAQAGQVFTNLVDFLDADYLPGAQASPVLDAFCGEPVPMINEIIISNQATKLVSGPITNILYEVFVDIEIWNPFTNQYSFRLDYDSSGISFPLNLVFPPTSPTVIDMSGVIPVRTPPVGTEISIASEGFALVQYRFTNQVAITPPFSGIGTVVTLNGAMSNHLAQANFEVVDRLNFNSLSTSPLQIQLAVNNLNSIQPNVATPGLSIASLNVDDPRMNHLPRVLNPANSGWYLSVGAPANNPASPGETNSRAYSAATSSGEGFNQQFLPKLYVRNAPFNSNSPPGGLGELGYVGTGERWRSIALYDHPSNLFTNNPVLDYFMVGSTNAVRPGLVSMNSVNSNALASVFLGAPVNSRPGEAPVENLSVARAEDIAGDLFDLGGGITNLAAIGTIASVLSQGQQTDDLHEAVIRNSIGLLTVRQNLFAVIVEAQALGERPPGGGVQPVLGVARALAHVWRDPFANNSGIHPMYIRQFMYLDENF